MSSGLTGEASLNDLSAAVYGGGPGPSPQDLATIGGLGTGILIMTGGTVVLLRRKPYVPGSFQWTPPISIADVDQAWREWQAAEEQFARLRQHQEDLIQRRKQLIEDWISLQKEIEELEGKTGFTGRYSIVQGLGLILGLVAAALPETWPVAAAWGMRIVGGGAGLGAGLVKGSQQGLKADLSRAFAITDSKINDVDREMDAFKRVYQIGEDRVKATKGRYDSVRGRAY